MGFCSSCHRTWDSTMYIQVCPRDCELVLKAMDGAPEVQITKDNFDQFTFFDPAFCGGTTLDDFSVPQDICAELQGFTKDEGDGFSGEKFLGTDCKLYTLPEPQVCQQFSALPTDDVIYHESYLLSIGDLGCQMLRVRYPDRKTYCEKVTAANLEVKEVSLENLEGYSVNPRYDAGGNVLGCNYQQFQKPVFDPCAEFDKLYMAQLAATNGVTPKRDITQTPVLGRASDDGCNQQYAEEIKWTCDDIKSLPDLGKLPLADVKVLAFNESTNACHVHIPQCNGTFLSSDKQRYETSHTINVGERFLNMAGAAPQTFNVQNFFDYDVVISFTGDAMVEQVTDDGQQYSLWLYGGLASGAPSGQGSTFTQNTDTWSGYNIDMGAVNHVGGPVANVASTSLTLLDHPNTFTEQVTGVYRLGAGQVATFTVVPYLIFNQPVANAVQFNADIEFHYTVTPILG